MLKIFRQTKNTLIQRITLKCKETKPSNRYKLLNFYHVFTLQTIEIYTT